LAAPHSALLCARVRALVGIPPISIEIACIQKTKPPLSLKLGSKLSLFLFTFSLYFFFFLGASFFLSVSSPLLAAAFAASVVMQ
jgi:hypothetical protein